MRKFIASGCKIDGFPGNMTNPEFVDWLLENTLKL
jgi:hypothetical protein